MRPTTLAVALLVVLAGPARGQSSQPSPTRPKRLVVLETRAVGHVEPKTIAGVSAYLASEAAKSGVRVLAPADVNAVLGVEKQKAMLGCADEACLLELGGALGAEYLLASEISEFGGEWLLNASLLETRTSRSLARATRRAPEQRDLLALVPVVVGHVLQPLTGAPAPAEPVIVRPPPRRTLGLVLDVGAVVVAAAGGVCQFASVQAWEDAKRLGNEGKDYPGFKAAKERSDNTLIAAGALYGAGAIALGVGLYFTFAGGSSTPPVAFVPAPGGGVIVAGGSF